MRFLKLVFIVQLLTLSGCYVQQPERIIIPQCKVNVVNGPIILDYMWLNGCVDCQLMDASRWVRRQNDLMKMGDDYRASIICILSFDKEADATIVEKYRFLQREYNNVFFVYSRNDVLKFCRDNSFYPHRSFTCLLDKDGAIVTKGGNPKKDSEAFKQYSSLIYMYNNNH